MPAEPEAEVGMARIVIDSDLKAVRDGLQDLFASALMTELSAESRGTAEIVLAEALNNVVEHAYATYPGKIEVSMQRQDHGLSVEVVDRGLPMRQAGLPGGNLPAGRPPQQGSLDDLPEGGFGWFLIRSLSQDLSYAREADRNCLRFSLPVDDAA